LAWSFSCMVHRADEKCIAWFCSPGICHSPALVQSFVSSIIFGALKSLC
jgi:hypothetical protein